MAEEFSLSELIIPGTYIRVRPEGLVGAGGLATGNVAIVGTAEKVPADTQILSDYAAGRDAFGDYDAFSAKTKNLTRGLEVLFRNGARTVYARALAVPAGGAAVSTADFTTAFEELLKNDVNILVVPELSTTDARSVLTSLLETAENNNRDAMAVIGSDKDTVADIKGQVAANDRVILAAPGIAARDAADKGKEVILPGTYAAAAVAGLLSSLAPQSSPTNKVLSGVDRLGKRFSYGEMKDLVKGGVMVLEERQGVRVVRGVTTEMADNGPFRQVTTRRITDFAKAGIRQVSNPFIGRLNNQRVRKALQGAIDGFLTTMVQDEALTEYDLQVTATRQDEINNRVIVTATVKPTFSIDFVAVTLILQ